MARLSSLTLETIRELSRTRLGATASHPDPRGASRIPRGENTRLKESRQLLFGVACLSVAALATQLAQASGPEASPSSATAATPEGRWRTVDDKTGKAQSIILIWQDRGRLYGRIEKLLDSDPDDPDPRCTRCEGELRNRPLLGLTIMWDLQKNGDQWSGKILDPDSGKTYQCSIAVSGDKLKVRGFIGISLLGRTQYWFRESERPDS
jgi:uncharacterized protein (DUF2147 family)